jgi:hypothetical protein
MFGSTRTKTPRSVPTLRLDSDDVRAADTTEGPVLPSKVVRDGSSEVSIRDALSAVGDGAGDQGSHR